MAKRPEYAVVHFQRFKTKKEAQERSLSVGGEIVEVHPYNEPCPKGSDHAHAMYDGATYCISCGRYLSLRLEKRL